MRLEHLVCNGTDVADLSPLAGMPLTFLGISGTRVRDLSVLRGMPLSHLYCSATMVTDLSPLAGMKLVQITLFRTRISDLSPLAGMPVEQLCYDIRLFDEDDRALIQSFPLTRWSVSSLTTTIATPAAQTRKEVETRCEAALAFAKATSMLPPSEQTKSVAAKLEQLNGEGAVGLGFLPIEDQVAHATLTLKDSRSRTRPMDITPLMAFTQLKKLEIIGGMPWLDISCVIHLPLEELTCSPEIAFKNAGVLKKVKTLRTINGEPAGQFWQTLGAK